MEVICASADCKHIDDESCCRLREIALSEHYMHTVNEGFQHLWRCKQYEQSAESKRLEEQFTKLLKELGMTRYTQNDDYCSKGERKHGTNSEN